MKLYPEWASFKNFRIKKKKSLTTSPKIKFKKKSLYESEPEKEKSSLNTNQIFKENILIGNWTLTGPATSEVFRWSKEASCR